MVQIIIGVVVALVLAGTGVFYYSSMETTEDTQPNTERITEGAFAPTVNNLSGTGNFQELLNFSQSVSCTVAYTVEGQGEFEGEVYVADAKMRGDFIYTAEGQQMQMSVINDGSKGYTWGTTPMGSIAMQYDVTTMDQDADNQDTGFDYDQRVSYSCAPWNADPVAFIPPSDISFMDMTASMGSDMNIQIDPQTTGGQGSAQCQTCEMITDAGPKEQCLQAFSCN